MRLMIWALAVAMGGGATSVAADTQEVIGNFRYSESADPITDAHLVRAFARTENGSIGLKCDEPRDLYVHLVSKEFLGGSDTRKEFRRMLLRFDNDAPIDTSWAYRDTSAVEFGKREALRFAERMRSAKTLTMRAYRYDSRSVDYVFDLTGADQAVTKVLAACGVT